jgi:hypothetical protein
MIRVFDFRCENGHLFEDFVEQDVTTSRCGCGANARKVIAQVNFALDGTDPGFPTAWDRWKKDHENAAKVKSS